jgi:hypothetical protein
MKWYLDWLFVRGVNMIFPHAFYYSIRGDLRRNERPPDAGPNNIWWPQYHRFSDYMKRMSLLLTDSTNQAQVAVLCADDSLPWEICKPLYQHQIEFNYLPVSNLVSEECRISGGVIQLHKQCYRSVVIQDRALLCGEAGRILNEFAADGGSVVVTDDYEEVVPALRDILMPDLELEPVMPGIRATHLVRDNMHLYILTNEGDCAAEGLLSLATRHDIWRWDAWSGTMEPVMARYVTPVFSTMDFYLERRSSVVYCVSPGVINLFPRDAGFVPPAVTEIPISISWECGCHGETQAELPALSSWTGWKGHEHFSGTFTYSGEFSFSPADVAAPGSITAIELDLGDVGEMARLSINGNDAGVKMWKPYRFSVRQFLRDGHNTIKCDVTNSLANEYNHASIPSGLMGPVILQVRR